MIDDARVERCRLCGALIIWARHSTTQKYNPIDAKPVANGNIRVASDMFGEASYWIDEGDEPGDRYVSHFATCPRADDIRQRRD